MTTAPNPVPADAGHERPDGVTVTLQQTLHRLPADMDTPISLWLDMVGDADGILLESAEVDGRWGRYSVIGCDLTLLARSAGGRLALELRDQRLAPLRDLEGIPFVDGLRGLLSRLHILPPAGADAPPPITRALYGYLGFGLASLFNPVLGQSLPPAEAEACLALPGTVLLFDHLYQRLIRLSLDGRMPGEQRRQAANGREYAAEADAADADAASPAPEAAVRAEPDEAAFKAAVARIRHLLRQGEAIQVVPSVRFSMPFSGDPFACYRRARRMNASPYLFYMRFPGLALFGSSPEVMVRCSAGRLSLAPIAGTRPRGADEAQDEALAAELRADPKERAEHIMLVDLARNDLGRIARPGSVRVDRLMEVERFSHVMHLTSRISADLAASVDGHDGSGVLTPRAPDAVDVLAAAFPAGTVSGAPKLRAMEIIRQLEGRGRGPYAGCVGWIGLGADTEEASAVNTVNGVNLDMGITIRSMWVRDGRLYWQAGAGIVHDSDPDAEWREVLHKSALMRAALRPGGEDHVPARR